MTQMNNEWKVKFKIIDKRLHEKRKKSVVSNINVEVPTELLSGVWRVIWDEISRLKSEGIIK